MAVQKRRQSSARRDSRRAQWMKMATPASSVCPNCQVAKMLYRICEACGWYGPAKEGRVVIPQPTENEAAAEKA